MSQLDTNKVSFLKIISTYNSLQNSLSLPGTYLGIAFPQKAKSLSRVQLFATLWTVAHQAPLSMGFFRQETGVGCYSLLQGTFPTQESNPGLFHFLHQQIDSLPLAPSGPILKIGLVHEVLSSLYFAPQLRLYISDTKHFK